MGTVKLFLMCFYWCIIVSHHNENQVDSNMHTALGAPPATPPLIQSTEFDIGIFSCVHMVDGSNSIMNFILPLPLPLDPFPDSTEASPLLSGVLFVSPLLPSLHILEETYGPSPSVID